MKRPKPSRMPVGPALVISVGAALAGCPPKQPAQHTSPPPMIPPQEEVGPPPQQPPEPDEVSKPPQQPRADGEMRTQPPLVGPFDHLRRR